MGGLQPGIGGPSFRPRGAFSQASGGLQPGPGGFSARPRGEKPCSLLTDPSNRTWRLPDKPKGLRVDFMGRQKSLSCPHSGLRGLGHKNWIIRTLPPSGPLPCYHTYNNLPQFTTTNSRARVPMTTYCLWASSFHIPRKFCCLDQRTSLNSLLKQQ